MIREFNYIPDFSYKLNRLMYDKKMTQKRLAQILGCERKTVHNYCNEVCVPNAAVLVEICRALKTTPNYLLGFGERSEKNEID